MSEVVVTMKRLDTFWRHSNCNLCTKMQVARAVIATKLLYGLETAQLGEGSIKKLEILQLRIIRKRY